MLLVNLWDLVSASVLWLLLGRQRALSPYSLFLSQLWVMSPHVTWSVRSSAKHSLWTAAARRKFTLGLIPAVSVYSFLVLGWWFFFTFPTSPWTIIWVCSSWYNPPKARKILFCFKSFFFFFLYASAHGCERLGLRHAAKAIKEVLCYNSCRITGFSTVITAPFVVHTKASCLQ